MNVDLGRKLEKFMETAEMSLSKVASGLGIGTSTLSEWKNDKYKGDCKSLEIKIEEYLKRHEDPAKRINFCVLTEVTRKIFYVLDTVAEYVASATKDKIIESAKIGFITGKAGIGKTFSLLEYKKAHENTIVFITAEINDRENDIIRKIAKELRIMESMYGRIAAVKEKIKERLRNSEKIIVVDEGEHLSPRAIDCVRAIADQTGVGVVIVGTEKLEAQITSGRNEYEYLYSRTVVYVRLNKLNEEDTKEIVTKYLGNNYTVGEINDLSKKFHEECAGSARNLSNLLPLATKITIANMENTKGKVTPRIVSEARKYLAITV